VEVETEEVRKGPPSTLLRNAIVTYGVGALLLGAAVQWFVTREHARLQESLAQTRGRVVVEQLATELSPALIAGDIDRVRHDISAFFTREGLVAVRAVFDDGTVVETGDMRGASTLARSEIWGQTRTDGMPRLTLEIGVAAAEDPKGTFRSLVALWGGLMVGGGIVFGAAWYYRRRTGQVAQAIDDIAAGAEERGMPAALRGADELSWLGRRVVAQLRLLRDLGVMRPEELPQVDLVGVEAANDGRGKRSRAA
jgi:hypothetical protein